MVLDLTRRGMEVEILSDRPTRPRLIMASHRMVNLSTARWTRPPSTIARCHTLLFISRRLMDSCTSELPLSLRTAASVAAEHLESNANELPLSRWWSVFWDVFRAKAGKGGTISARAFVEASTQAVDLGLGRNPNASQVSSGLRSIARQQLTCSTDLPTLRPSTPFAASDWSSSLPPARRSGLWSSSAPASDATASTDWTTTESGASSAESAAGADFEGAGGGSCRCCCGSASSGDEGEW